MANRFGSELRQRREAAGLSLAELAGRVHFSRGHLSKIENGRKAPTQTLARICDAALGAGGALVALAAVSTTPAKPAAGPGQGVEPEQIDEVLVMAIDGNSELRIAHLGRRQLMATGTFALLGLAVSSGARPAAPDERVVPGLQASFDQLRLLGMISSPLLVLPSVVCHAETVRKLAEDSQGPLRERLYLLAARVAEYAGWMCQETGDVSRARAWTERAVQLAMLGNDSSMPSYALVRYAEMALYAQDAQRVIKLTRQVQQQPSLDTRVLALAARCEAQGHALIGDFDEYRRAVDRAATLLAASSHDATAGLPLGSSSVPDQVALAAGSALVDLGRPAEAAEILDREVARIGGNARRARARFGARRALAQAVNGEIDHACVLLRDVIEDALHVDSATVRMDLRQVARTLARWHSHRPVRDLLPELSEAMLDPVR